MVLSLSPAPENLRPEKDNEAPPRMICLHGGPLAGWGSGGVIIKETTLENRPFISKIKMSLFQSFITFSSGEVSPTSTLFPLKSSKLLHWDVRCISFFVAI